MNGTPVWLCSISRPNPFRRARLPTNRWTLEQRAEAIDLLRAALGPVGNPARERVFRMQVTICLHRAATADEIAGLSCSLDEASAIDIAGGPVEILEETEPGAPSTRPCLNVRRHQFDSGDRDLWVPIDCGICEPCRARRLVNGRDVPVMHAGVQWDRMLAARAERCLWSPDER
jgi:hypothetical protein